MTVGVRGVRFCILELSQRLFGLDTRLFRLALRPITLLRSVKRKVLCLFRWTPAPTVGPTFADSVFGSHLSRTTHLLTSQLGMYLVPVVAGWLVYSRIPISVVVSSELSGLNLEGERLGRRFLSAYLMRFNPWVGLRGFPKTKIP
jgi:hypothetical protein